MKTFEPFLKEGSDSQAFGLDLENRALEAITNQQSLNYPPFDQYGLTPLGWAIGDELERVVSSSDLPIMGLPLSAKPYIRRCLDRARERFGDDLPAVEQGMLYSPSNRPLSEAQLGAEAIALNIFIAGVNAVVDANIMGRSILGILENTDPQQKEAVLRNSTRLLVRLAKLEDTRGGNNSGRFRFQQFVGVYDSYMYPISPNHLVFDPVHNDVDLSPAAKEAAERCSTPGEGCPALRIQVNHKNKTIPMIRAFWDSSVDVIASRLATTDQQ